MSQWDRLSVLATGAALSTAGLLGSIGSTATAQSSPDSFAVGEPDGWSAALGNAANSRYLPLVEDFSEPDTDAWRYAETGSVAVVDGTVYVQTDAELHALDADSGDLEWEIETDASGRPTVVGETVSISSDDHVMAFDAADGSLEWEVALNTDEPIATPTATSETIYTVAGETLYALDVDDGSIRWERDQVQVRPEYELGGGADDPVSTSFQAESVAVVNGSVYAVTDSVEFEDGSDSYEFPGGVAAVDAATGEDEWGIALESGVSTAPIATDAFVFARYEGLGAPGLGNLLDPETGDPSGEAGRLMAATPDARVTVSDYSLSVTADGSGENWSASTGIHGWHSLAIAGNTLLVSHGPDSSSEYEYPHDSIVGFDLADGTAQWVLEFDELPGILAVDENTVYVELADELVAMRASDDAGESNDRGGTVDRPADTRVVRDQTGPSGVRIAVQEDLAGLELTISEQTTGVDTAEIADELGNTLATADVSGLGPGDTVRIEHDLAAGEEYIVLVSADDAYDRGAYNENPDWPYDGGQFQVVEGIWDRDNSSTNNFYAYSRLTALL